MNPILIGLQAIPPSVLMLAALLSLAICAHAGEPTAPPALSDKAARNAWVLHEVVRRFESGKQVEPELYQEFSKAQIEGLKTGPDVGQKVPDFTLPDYTGGRWTLAQLMGPKGLVLSFQRSADW